MKGLKVVGLALISIVSVSLSASFEQQLVAEGKKRITPLDYLSNIADGKNNQYSRSYSVLVRTMKEKDSNLYNGLVENVEDLSNKYKIKGFVYSTSKKKEVPVESLNDLIDMIKEKIKSKYDLYMNRSR